MKPTASAGTGVAEPRKQSQSRYIGSTGTIADSGSDRQSEGLGRTKRPPDRSAMLTQMRANIKPDPIFTGDPDTNDAAFATRSKCMPMQSRREFGPVNRRATAALPVNVLA